MIRTTLFATVAVSIALGASVPAVAADFGFNLNATPTLVLRALNTGTRTRLHLEVPTLNVGAGEAYCSWSLGSALVPAAAGSFMVEAEHPINYAPGSIPSNNDLWCVAYPRTSQPTVPFTVEVEQTGL